MIYNKVRNGDITRSSDEEAIITNIRKSSYDNTTIVFDIKFTKGLRCGEVAEHLCLKTWLSFKTWETLSGAEYRIKKLLDKVDEAT